MQNQSPIGSWVELELAHVFYAYRKAKADCYFERTAFVAEAFTRYEQKLYENLSQIWHRLRDGEIDQVLNEHVGAVVLVAKKLTKEPKNVGPQAHDFFSDPLQFFERLKESYKLTPEFRLVGTFSVEAHLVSALWVNLVGNEFDARLGSCAYGSRLRRFRPDAGSAPDRKGRFQIDALGSFEPYFTPYKSWRASGLAAIRGELEQERSVVAISLDLANFYHRIDPAFVALEDFQAEIGVRLSEWQKTFTRSFSQMLAKWSDLSASYIARQKGTPDVHYSGGLPIGLSISRVMANVLLHKLDEQLITGLTPVYYGRYVDDMFLVIRDPGGMTSAEDLFRWIHDRVPLLKPEKRRKNADRVTRVAFSNKYAGNSDITLQHAKQKVFFLTGTVGLDLLANIEGEIQEVSSERRLLPDPDGLERMASARVLSAGETAAEEVDTLRRANGLSVRRLGWSVLLLSVETLARDLPPQEWRPARVRFYEFARGHILRPDRILDHADYLPRLLSLSVALKDWGEARMLWSNCQLAIHSLRDASRDEAKGEAAPFRIKLNGYAANPEASDVWDAFEDHLRKVCAEAVLRSVRWTDGRADIIESASARNLLHDLGLHPQNDEVEQRALALVEADWSKISYKDHIRRRAISPRKPSDYEDALSELYAFKEDLIEFLNIADLSYAKPLSVSRTKFDPIQAESLVPYLCATRPYSAAEIALFIPECIGTGGNIIWSKFVRAMRGAWSNLQSGNVEQAEHSFVHGSAQPPVVQVGLSEMGQTISLGISSLATDDESWRKAAQRTPDYSAKRYKKIGDLIKLAVKTYPRPTHLLLPELSLPERWLGSIAARLRESGISLIAGLEYNHHRKNPAKINSEAVLFLSDNRLGYSSWVEIRQAKSVPAPREEYQLLHDFGLEWDYSANAKQVYDHKGFRFGLLVCSELQNMDHRRKFQGQVDCLIVLSWNQDLDTFSALVESASLDVHANIALVNNRRYGDSRVRAPAKASYERDVCRLRGGKNDHLVVVDLAIDDLRAFQSRAKRWPQPNDKYKPVPEGFEIAPDRRAIPR